MYRATFSTTQYCLKPDQLKIKVFRHFGDILAGKSSAWMTHVIILFVHTKKTNKQENLVSFERLNHLPSPCVSLMRVFMCAGMSVLHLRSCYCS